MEIARNTRAAKRSRETAAPGTGRERHTKIEHEEEQNKNEDSSSNKRSYGPKPSLPNLAVHFTELTNAVLRSIQDDATNDKVYDKFMQNAKEKLICDLMRTYKDLYNFYNYPSLKMPEWLSKSPPAKYFHIHEMDGRLLSKALQAAEELRTFVKELGFVCLSLRTPNVWTNSFNVKLRLDVATVPTTEARKHVESRLLTFERVLQWPNFSSGP